MRSLCVHREYCGLYRATEPVSVSSCIRFKTSLDSKNSKESDSSNGKG